MSRAGGLAGSGARRHGILEILAIIGVPYVFGEDHVGHLLVFGRRGVFGRGQLLAELEGVARTGLDAHAAGDALGLVDLGDVVRADDVARAEHQTDAQTEAGAGAAVADSGALTGLFDVGDVVHEAVFLSALDDLKGFLAGDLAGAAGTDVMLGPLAHLDAHLLGQMAAAVVDRGA